MNKVLISVPSEIKYISEWENFTLPLGHSIINKTVCGCGFTEYCIHSDIPTILCSPRKFLLENKYEQNNNCCYLVVNSLEKSLGIDSSLNEDSAQENISLNFNIVSNLKSNLSQYLLSCHLSQKTPKILVTYDSLKYVLEVLGKDIQNFSVVVDEFQNIFMDAQFKASTELNFISYLQDCPNVTYVSATPMLDNYLNELDEFRDLPYYEFIWDKSRLVRIDITKKIVKSLNSEISSIICKYRKGIFPRKILEDGTIYESKEAVFYVNSVKMICQLVKKNNLQPCETNIICSKDKRNIDKLKKLGHSIGTAPLKGQSHKMFTFCTRTVYAGADFYSPCASTVIASNAKITTLAVDISLDLPQIMGRQRLEENVFRTHGLFLYVNPKKGDEITKENFERKVKEKERATEEYISLFEKGNKNEKARAIAFARSNIYFKSYSDDYVGISDKLGIVKENSLVKLAERRAWELQCSVYSSEICILGEFVNNRFNVINSNESEIKNFIIEFNSKTRFDDRMRLYCDFLLEFYSSIQTTDIPGIPQEYKNYMNLLGPDRIRALGYYQKALEEEINKSSIMLSKAKDLILKSFQFSQKYTLKEVKDKLGEIYTTLGISKTPKANDLEEYYEVKLINIPIDGKRQKGYELLKIR